MLWGKRPGSTERHCHERRWAAARKVSLWLLSRCVKPALRWLWGPTQAPSLAARAGLIDWDGVYQTVQPHATFAAGVLFGVAWWVARLRWSGRRRLTTLVRFIHACEFAAHPPAFHALVLRVNPAGRPARPMPSTNRPLIHARNNCTRFCPLQVGMGRCAALFHCGGGRVLFAGDAGAGAGRHGRRGADELRQPRGGDGRLPG